MKCKRSFTIIELSITLAAVLCILAFSVNLVLRSKQKILIDCLRLLQIEFIALQQQALACNQTYCVQFLPINNSFQIIQLEKTTTHHLPKNIAFGFLDNVFGPPGKPNHAIQKAINFENPRPLAAIIQPHGRISSGCVYLVHTSGMAMGAISITPHQIAHVRTYILDSKKNWQLLAV